MKKGLLLCAMLFGSMSAMAQGAKEERDTYLEW